jgi:RHS repeat-associated protein
VETFTFDQNGSMTSRTDQQGTTQYGNDGAIHLSSVTLPGGATQDYEYATDVRRVKRFAGVDSRAYVSEGHVLYEYDSTLTTLLAEYVYMPGAATPLFTIRFTPDPEVLYFHTDHLGTPRMLTDASATVVWKATYAPYGAAEINDDPDQDGQHVDMPIRLPGQWADPGTGMYYNWYRHYDPTLGAYAQSDPINVGAVVVGRRRVHLLHPSMARQEVLPELSASAYVAYQPLVLIDPTGLAKVCKSGKCPDCPNGIWSGGGFVWEIGFGVGYLYGCATLDCWSAGASSYLCFECIRGMFGFAAAAGSVGLYCSGAYCKEDLKGESFGPAGAAGLGAIGAGAGKTSSQTSSCISAVAGLGVGLYVSLDNCWTD